MLFKESICFSKRSLTPPAKTAIFKPREPKSLVLETLKPKMHFSQIETYEVFLIETKMLFKEPICFSKGASLTQVTQFRTT